MSTTNSVPPKRVELKPPHQRLVLMFDGTGNKRLNLSNVARMFEAIDDSLPRSYVTNPMMGPDGPCVNCRLPERLNPDQEPVQLVKYIKGVGTNLFGHFSGLGFGFGLSANVIEGYVWLSNNYREGDEIFVFGFSRGAFSARSLVSLVHQCGGVLKNVSEFVENKPELKVCDQVVVDAYAMYQAYVQTTDSDGVDIQNDPAPYKDFCNKFHVFKATTELKRYKIHKVKVKMLGVWDTVGALGLPETGCKFIDNYILPLSRFNSKQYQFHGQGLSCIVENAYHALAIDEHRKHFEPTLWNSKTSEDQEVKQVWFAGSHCNVGGGADLEDFIDPDDLWQYSYVWMQRHAQKHGLRFYWTYDSPATHKVDHEKSIPTRRVSLRTPEDSYSLFLGGAYKWFFGSIDREVVMTNGAKLHWSVTDRIEQAKLHWSEQSIKKNEKPSYYLTIMSLFGKGDRIEKDEKHSYFPTSLFGKSGNRFRSVGADMFEIEKIDVNGPELVKGTEWQIETDPEVNQVMMEPSIPLKSLEVTKCGCGAGDPPTPPKQKGLWSLLGY